MVESFQISNPDSVEVKQINEIWNYVLLDIRNAPFEGKTSVWIPYSETGYTTGKRLGEEEDPKTKKKKIKVLREVDGKEKLYDEAQVEPRNPPKYGR